MDQCVCVFLCSGRFVAYKYINCGVQHERSLTDFRERLYNRCKKSLDVGVDALDIMTPAESHAV